MINTIKAVDLFCGAGGTTTGLREACEKRGFALDLLAINHWNVAIKTLRLNHPDLRPLCAKVDNIDPWQVVSGRHLDLLVASPECFPAGTLILTENGLVPVENVQVGVKVLTHLGRWMPVTQALRSTKDTIVLRGQGHYGLETTAEHPFFARTRKQRWHNPRRQYRWQYSEPEWVQASGLVDCMWATPIHMEPIPIPPVGGRGANFCFDFWWMIGRWLADGTVRIRKWNSEMTIASGKHKADVLEERLAFSPATGFRAGKGEYRWRRREIRTATLFEMAHQGLSQWIVKYFGKLAHGKMIPAWVLTMDTEHRRALLEGYLSGDGYENSRRIEACSVSKNLAVGFRLIAESLGYRVCFSRWEGGAGEIEGRHINARPSYHIYWSKMPEKRVFGLRDDQHSWQQVKRIESGRAGISVYNLSVAEDESFVADGIVVHNCLHFSRACGGRPRSEQSRASAWLILRWLEALKVDNVLIENVPEFRTWGPLGSDRMPLKSRKGETFEAFLGALRSLGYTVDHQIFNAADYGDVTTRKRLFIQARRGRRPIAWPAPTHTLDGASGPSGSMQRWRAAREIIDWTIRGKSIFTRKRPLKEATIERIKTGLRRFGGEGAEPFLVILRNHMTARSIDSPLPTITAGGGHVGLCEPFVLSAGSGGAPRRVGEPIPTITTTSRGMALVEPFLVNYHGNRPGKKDGHRRVHSVDSPIPTLDTSNRYGLVEPFLISYYGNGSAMPVTDPLATVTTRDRFGLVQPTGLDILFRMFQPHELAAAMGLEGYQFYGNKTEQVKQIGNAVPKNLAAALCGELLPS